MIHGPDSVPLVKEPNVEPIPGYRLIEPLGNGGFGEVWKCEAPGGIYKAIKFVYGNLHALDVEGVRAEQELSALERVKNIRHPFLLSIERVEDIKGELVIVMELADKDLHDVFVENRQKGLVGIERNELLGYLRDAAEALDLMNKQHNLQHLDIKPSNLFLVSNRVKVADFGLVKALEGRTVISPTSGLMGGVTPVYAAPETFAGGLSQHSDQYSLAIVYQELLTGGLPFKGKNARQLMMQHTQMEPELEPLPATDRSIVAKALAKKPEDRWPSCKDFIRALIQATPGARKWETMEDIFLDPQAQPVFSDAQPKAGMGSYPPTQFILGGALRPTFLIGLGRFGREALQALKCRAVDRFGSMENLPHWRMLYIDSDPKDITNATLGTPEQALSPTEVLHTPIKAVGHYRRSRQSFEQLLSWLPMEKFYEMPRSLDVSGSRMLGRLAFVDGYLRIVGRLKRELQSLLEPGLLEKAEQLTGIRRRSDSPQIYVFAAAGGGTGSGMLIDLCYTMKRLMQESGLSQQEIITYLYLGAPSDNATPLEEKANVYATLTELHHFGSNQAEFVAEYGQGIQLKDLAPPAQATYMARVSHRTPDSPREVASRLASYIFHDLSTPMGGYLDYSRQKQPLSEAPFRSFGSYAIWFPRGLMLRVAARLASQRLIHRWLQQEETGDWWPTAQTYCEQLLSDPSMQPDLISRRIEQAATTPKDGTPDEALMAILTQIENQLELAVAREDPINWCHDVLKRIKEYVGGSSSPREDSSDWQKSRMNRIYSTATQKIADEYTEFMSMPSRSLFEMPGTRLAAADACYRYLHQRLNELIEQQHAKVRDFRSETEKYWIQVNTAFEACMKPGSFFLFANMRTQKLLRSFVEKIAVFTRQRLREQNVRAVEEVYRALQNRLLDLRRDLGFCVQRLQHVEHNLIAAPPEAEAARALLQNEVVDQEQSAFTSSKMLQDAALVLASRVVLPEGQTDLEKAAVRFLNQVHIEDWLELDQYLQETVLTPHGGLYSLCMTNADLPRTLIPPLLEKATEYLDRHLEVTDVCQAELSSAEALGVDVVAQTKALHRLAQPSIPSKRGGEKDFLLVPDSTAGKTFIEMAKQAVPDMTILTIQSPTDLLICREQPAITPQDMREILQNCKSAYQELFVSNLTNPHARCDLMEWMPLDP